VNIKEEHKELNDLLTRVYSEKDFFASKEERKLLIEKIGNYRGFLERFMIVEEPLAKSMTTVTNKELLSCLKFVVRIIGLIKGT